MIDDIIDLSRKKQWCEADYDTVFNYRFNKCGFCLKMKQAIVKQQWSDSELYPLINRLACVNKECLFYLIFNTDVLID